MTDFDERHEQLARVAFERSHLLQNTYFSRKNFEGQILAFFEKNIYHLKYANILECVDFWQKILLVMTHRRNSITDLTLLWMAPFGFSTHLVSFKHEE